VVVPEVISRAYVGYFPLMASQPFGGAEAHGNNQRHENNFYRRGVVERSKEKICLELVVFYIFDSSERKDY
jgi:hypothetical protein